MKAASLHELKKELNSLSPLKLTELCLRLAKHKKENKELLTYLLFEAHDEDQYIKTLKDEINEQLVGLNTNNNLYLIKKSLRKILRTINKYIKFSGSKHTETELLIYFCTKLKNSNIPINESTALTNLYLQLLKRINKSISSLHEDFQYDYQLILEKL